MSSKIVIRGLIVVILLTQLACQTVMEFLPISETPTPDAGSAATTETTESTALSTHGHATPARRPLRHHRAWRARATMATASPASKRRNG